MSEQRQSCLVLERRLDALKEGLDQRGGADEPYRLLLLGLEPKGGGEAVVSAAPAA
ncbi:hypothetical protein [Kitasatospora cineracea]|uniref:hypothetical protein n=1 Tax=Kitasatospora cineracea TaxID=88074 RepID=UPI003829F214